MGSASSKFKKYLQHGDEFAAMQVYQSSHDLREHLDPSASYGESHNHNTPLHYAAKHGMKHLVRAFLSDRGGNPNKRNGDDESAIHCICKVGQVKSPSAEERRTMCMSLMLMWRGPLMQDGEKERPQLNAQDKKGNTALHYASMSGLRKCVELLVFQGAGLFIENNDKMTPCELTVKAGHHDVASYLETRMVFADTSDTVNEGELQAVPPETESDEGDSDVYAGLRAQDLQEAKDQLLVETADMLHVPLFTAEALLRDNEWSKTLLLEKWMSNAIQCCEIAGIAPPNSALQIFAPSPPVGEGGSLPLSLSAIITPPPPHARQSNEAFNDLDEGEKEILCEICLDEMSSWECGADGPSCGHRFCYSCWEAYLNLKIEEGAAHNILCPAVECNILVDVDFIEKMVSPQVARKYLQFDIEAFVERNKTIKWCPLPGCGRAVRYPEAELPDHPRRPFSNALPPAAKTSHAVDCGNGHFFCWDCLGEAHSPCGCDQWFDWQGKVAEVRPEELKIASGETEDSANFLWLVTNSKPCPNCKSPIQKNEGCNHMKCSKCKYVFCWVCLESWKKHSSATGGYFRCNRYGVQVKADEKMGVLISEASVRNHEMQELSRFIHYYTCFKNHQNSLKLEEPLLKLAKFKMEALASSIPNKHRQTEDSKEKGTKFIEEGIKELLKARRVLCGSYVYGYYLQDNGCNKTIFEYMQNELEDTVEKLSEMVAREYLVTPRGEIIAATLVVRKRRHKFVRAVGRGLLPPDTPPALRKARRRRVPTLIGMDASQELESIEAMGRALEHSQQPWVKDSSGRHTNLAALLDWPHFDSDDEESSLSHALTLTLLGKCLRQSCPRPRARNPRTGSIHEFCSLRCAQQAKYFHNHAQSETCVSAPALDGCDSNLELLIALEMSRLQMIEDEARKRQSWLQERSRDHHHHHQRWTTTSSSSSASRNYKDQQQQFWSHTLPHRRSSSERNNAVLLSSAYVGSVDDTKDHYPARLPPPHPPSPPPPFYEGGFASSSNSQGPPAPPYEGDSSCDSWTGHPAQNSSSSQLSSAEIAVDYFLKRLANNKISLRNLNVDVESDHKVEKDLLCFPKKPHRNEDGRFEYGDLHENGHLLSFLPFADLRRSQSLGDLTSDRSSDLELMLDSEHAHQDFPEASSKVHLSRPLTNQRDSRDSLDVESGSAGEGDVEWTDQGVPSDVMGELDSPLTDLEVRGILGHLDDGTTTSQDGEGEPSFHFVVDEGTDKDESNSTERSPCSQRSSQRLGKASSSPSPSNLRIHISHPNQLETQSSTEFESETGIPNSPTLYISGVSISRSPEPRSPKTATTSTRSPTLHLPACRTPEPRSSSSSALLLPLYTRSRSSSLIVPGTATTPARLLDPCAAYATRSSSSVKGLSAPRRCIHLSSLSLQATRASSPFLLTELRVSRSASETEKGRLMFQFPKSPTEGALSSVLHVEESTLSSDDFHEALFLSKSPKPAKRKKSKRERNKDKGEEKRERNKDKDGREKVSEEKRESKTKERAREGSSKDWKEKHKDGKDKRKGTDVSTVV